MRLQATQSIVIPEGSFAQGDTFETSPEIGARLIAKGHAQEPVEAVETREPDVETRDPEVAPSRRKRK